MVHGDGRRAASFAEPPRTLEHFLARPFKDKALAKWIPAAKQVPELLAERYLAFPIGD